MIEVWFTEDQPWADRARFLVLERHPDRSIIHKPDGAVHVDQSSPATVMTLPDDCYHVLRLDALAPLENALADKLRLRHDSPQLQRADFEHERVRADKMLDVLLDLATSWKPTNITVGPKP